MMDVFDGILNTLYESILNDLETFQFHANGQQKKNLAEALDGYSWMDVEYVGQTGIREPDF
jgi:hypothetical protein